VSDDDMREVPGGAFNLNYIVHPDHGPYGDLPLQGKIPTAESGIEPGTSWLVVRGSDHQTKRLVRINECINNTFIIMYEYTVPIACLGKKLFNHWDSNSLK
jgi:hypothetical protein